tara:strand:+ start:706 stop:915 length:210 start_codon:yes stop_codon:yes gene_type:complete
MINQNRESEKYQDMLHRVEDIITEISSQEIDLDSVIEKVEAGYDLLGKMRERLDETKEKIEAVRKKNES